MRMALYPLLKRTAIYDRMLREATYVSRELGAAAGVGRYQVVRDLKWMREALGAPIETNPLRYSKKFDCCRAVLKHLGFLRPRGG